MHKIRVLVVDDSFFMRKIISDILSGDPGLEVIGEAVDGNDALEKIDKLRPEVVTLDYEMPHLNGLEAFKKIVEKTNRPSVIVVSGYVKEGAEVTLKFLEAGAVDFILKPSGSLSLDMDKVGKELIEKVKIAASVDPYKKFHNQLRANTAKMLPFKKGQGVVVIGSSTGGPAALQALLPIFPEHFPLPIVVAQHLPEAFIRSFVERLAKDCQLKVVRAEDGIEINPGVIYMAPGGNDTEIHMNIEKKAALRVIENTKEIETPSVNKLMTSAADVYGEHTIGVILTGMGKDGSIGMGEIKKKGGTTLVQDKDTSVIYGMGKEVVDLGLADEILPLDTIVEKISEILTPPNG